MKKIACIRNSISFLLLAAVNSVPAQTLPQKLDKALKTFLRDAQMKHAITGFEVVDSKTGKTIYAYNQQAGLAAASTQKVFTSIAAFDLLGKDYRYYTNIGIDGNIMGDSLAGRLYIEGSGDPSFGSWRYASTKPTAIFLLLKEALLKKGIKKLSGEIYVHDNGFDKTAIPDGWIWQDIGNYYGAGAWGINWKENQYDLELSSGNDVHGQVSVKSNSYHGTRSGSYINQLSAGEKGSGDNAYIYLPYDDTSFLLAGTIPVGEPHFIISGAATSGPDFFVNECRRFLYNEKLMTHPGAVPYHAQLLPTDISNIVYTHISPALDSINYWFLKKSINLYGEAIAKTLAKEKLGYGSTENGVAVIKNFWKEKGIESSALNIMDGSGLSPQNRVTADALVKALQYARTRDWYASFFNALPEYNGIKMKSGSIGGARAYAGYHVAKNGSAYTFAIIVNNFDGAPSDVIKKMFIVLDNLK